ncbi:hypothetical protein LT40_03935 [Pseudomonas rhizosphaerae]|uniref:Toxin n=1 Tax=Pseudomonas rhizosphaerae TaxID=216142 RepID=A0A089YQD0_9PSED|nr:hypothetical protein [Pseudomonas rhizosphaerae]AIS16602.1 hypothetical protein LT40_03935 [Pseudomonas rhizosphaerae]
MTHLLSLSGEVARSAPLASSVSKHFASRPSLREVALQVLATQFAVVYPKLNVDFSHVHLFEPINRPGTASFAGYRKLSLANVLIDRYLHDEHISLVQGYHFLTAQAGAENPGALAVDMTQVQGIINEWGPQILQAYSEALCSYWDVTQPAGGNRWQWLGNALQVRLKHSVEREQKAGRLSNEQGATAMLLVSMPGARERALYTGDTIEASLFSVQAMGVPLQRHAELTHALIIRRRVSSHGGEVLLMYTPVNGLETFPTLQAMADAFAMHLGRAVTGPTLELVLYSPTGNIFEAQAQAILEQQLEALQALGRYCRASGFGAEALEQGTEYVTCLFDIDSAQERARLQALQDSLPTWLTKADDEQRREFSLYLATLAALREQQQRASYLDGIPTIADFAEQALVRQIGQDHPHAPLAAVDDVEVHILTVPNAQLSIVNAGDTTLQDHTISLVDLALYNLSGRPQGHLVVKPKAGATLPSWVDETSIQALVTKTDAGGSYLALLNQKLLLDPAEFVWRQALFGSQLQCQLPMLALENSIRGQWGFTRLGWKYVAGVMEASGDAEIEGVAIAIQGLGIWPAADMKVDQVCNMYVISAIDGTGLQVLYRPLMQPTLIQYPDRAALFEAIAEEGEVQRSVLDWLDAPARARYANGGFHQPHLVRFVQGSEFAPINVPAAATLKGVPLGSDVLAELYKASVNALVTVADRQSVSTEESRWIGYRAVGWTVFNALLPILPGPLATAGWLIQAMAASNVTLVAQAGGDKDAVDDQLVDLLFNIALVLLVHTTGRALAIREFRHPVLPAPAAATVATQLSPAPLQVFDANAHLSFSWARAQHRLSPEDATALASYRVAAPQPLPEPLPHGALRGLYLDGERWLLPLDGHFYPVMVDDGLVRIVDAARPQSPGPWVERDEVGRWRLDLHLRLRGGGPKRSIAALRAANRERMQACDQQITAFNRQRSALHDRVNQVLRKVNRAFDAKDSERLRGLRDALSEATGDYLSALRQVLAVSLELNRLEPYGNRAKEQASLLFQLCEVGQEEVINLRYKSLDYRDRADDISVLLDGSQMSDQQSQEFFDYVSNSIDILDKQIQLTKEIAQWKEQLRRMPIEGAAAVEKLTANWIEALSVRRWIGLLVDGLALTSIRYIATLEVADRVMDSVAEPVRLAAQTHAALEETADYNLNDRVELLNSLDLQYEAAQQSLAFYVEEIGDRLYAPARLRLANLIQELRDSAQAALVPLIREQFKMTRKQRQQARHKTIFVTRHRGLVVGQRRAKVAVTDRDIVDVIDPIEKKVLASFDKDPAQADWQALETAPVARPRPSGSTLNAAIRRGNQLLQGADQQIRNAWKEAQKPYLPVEVEDRLRVYAQQLSEAADAVEQQMTRDNAVDEATSQQTSAHGRAQVFRDKAAQLIEQGRLIHIHMVKWQPPAAARVDYLYREGEARISRVGARSKLKRSPGYLEEYLVADTASKPLWYAHFHYAHPRGPRDAYTAAHLKTVEQRFDGLEKQKSDEVAHGKWIGILRSEITPPFDGVYLAL